MGSRVRDTVTPHECLAAGVRVAGTCATTPGSGRPRRRLCAAARLFSCSTAVQTLGMHADDGPQNMGNAEHRINAMRQRAHSC